jgi:hypothetical protein
MLTSSLPTHNQIYSGSTPNPTPNLSHITHFGRFGWHAWIHVLGFARSDLYAWIRLLANRSCNARHSQKQQKTKNNSIPPCFASEFKAFRRAQIHVLRFVRSDLCCWGCLLA